MDKVNVLFIFIQDFSGVPACSHVFLEFLFRVRSTGLLRESPPTVVHCSAGIGRSGAFVVVDSILAMVVICCFYFKQTSLCLKKL